MFTLASVLTCLFLAPPPDAPRSAKEALQPFNYLIGSWRATGMPEGTREEKQKGFWTETMAWAWQFKGDDVWLKVAFDKGKYFKDGELRPLPDNRYRLELTTVDGMKVGFEGTLKERVLTLERSDEQKQETERLSIHLLHDNRFLYRYEVHPQGKKLFTRLYQVGATKEGVAFASGDGKPECIVSGGLGTMKVTYMGETYYVCCTGCRDAFNAEPEKYVQEYKAKLAKKK